MLIFINIFDSLYAIFFLNFFQKREHICLGLLFHWLQVFAIFKNFAYGVFYHKNC